MSSPISTPTPANASRCAPVVRAAGSDRVVETQIAAASGQGYVLDYVMRQESGGWKVVDVLVDGAISRLNDPKCAPCWPTAAAPGCSSACDRKPLTYPAVFCSSVAGAKTAGHFSATCICPRRVVKSWAACASPNLLAVLPERRDGVGMLSNNFWVQQPPHDASSSTSRMARPHRTPRAPSTPRSGCRSRPVPVVIEGRAEGCSTQRLD